jgi:uncharacterized protein (TIGR03437 family)
MLRVLTAVFFVCALAQAATSSATITVNATLTMSSSSTTSYTATGTASFTGAISATGNFSATISLSSLETGASIPFTITFSGGTMGGSLTIPISVFEAILSGQTSGSGASATITSASGTYQGDTGSFPSLAGTGAIGAGGITVTFTGNGTITTGGAVTAPPPTITAVLDAGSYTANIAQGSIFVVKGTNLSASGYTSLSYPLPTSSGGTSITFTPAAGGTGTQPYLVYTYNVAANGTTVNQLAAVLPSGLAAGTYDVTVTYNSATSSPFTVQVVKSKPGIITQDSTGNGLAVAQNIVSATEYDLNRLTTGTVNGYTISPAKPGQTLVLYLTGLGPVPGGDNVAEQAYNFLANGVTVQILVGGTAITPSYAGRTPGFSGLDQINFTLPSSISTGCTVVLQVQEGNTTSAPTTLSIAASGAGNCVLQGFTPSQLSFLDNGGTINSGSFPMSQTATTIPGTGSVTTSSISGGFSELTGFELPSVATGGSATVNSTTIGSCTVIQGTFMGNTTTPPPSAGGVSIPLDAGAVTISGPSASNLNKTTLTDSLGSYSLTIGETGISLPNAPTGTLAAGTYNLVAAGGTGVTGFSTSLTLGSPLTITGGLPTTVVRSSGLPLTWTGGNSTDVVTIFGLSGTTSGTGASAVTTASEFVCTTTAGTGGFTVSSQVLDLLPATPATSAGGSGILSVSSGPAPVSFTTTLTATPSTSLVGQFSAQLITQGLTTYQ